MQHDMLRLLTDSHVPPDGQPVSDALIVETLLELRQQFGAVSSETQIIRGQRESEGHVYPDDHMRVFLDVADSPENRRFFSSSRTALSGGFSKLI